ncbi:MAG: hypothetical protein WBQ23_14565 [Bacteroidota bacterium]
MNHEELRQTLESLLRSSVSSVQLSRLIHRSIRIAAGILKSRFSRYLVLLYDAGYTPESAASRCIEGLFLPHHDIPCARLTTFVRNACEGNGLSLNGDCEQVLQRCIFFNVQQNIPELLGEFDPQYKKILRMVMETVAKDSNYQRHRDFLEDMISRGPGESIQMEFPALTADELVAELSRRASPDDSTHVLVGKLFDILDDNAHVRRIVSISQLVTVIRDFFHLYWSFSSPDESKEIDRLFENGDIERIAQPILEALSSGILATYAKRGTLTREDAQHFLSAVSSMIADLASGEAAPWFEYHEQEFPHVSYEEYRDTYRGRFEYVLGSAKDLFFLRCQKYFRADFSATS